MAKSPNLLLCLSVLIFIITKSALAQKCSNYKFSTNRLFESCNDLSILDSFLHYTYDSSSGNLQIAYRHTKLTSGKWVAWAVNPTSTGMIGAQAIVAYPQSDGTVRAYTSPISSYQTSLQEAELSFNVSELSATYQNNEMVIYATLNLPLANGGIINTVWQDGSLSGNNPLPHPTSGNNVRSVSTLNLVSGASGSTSTGGGGGASKLRKRNIHGILNGVSWGIMMPIGAIIARYLKVSKSADPAWFYHYKKLGYSAFYFAIISLDSVIWPLRILNFPVVYLHVFCQSSAYIIGVAGWATGLKLGSESAGIQFTFHRAVGIVLFCLATIQVFAMFLRPKPEHKYRVYWNIYHHTVGYTVIILAVVNVFKGLDILSPEKQWRNTYTAIIVVLGIVAAVLEAFTWYVVIKRGKAEESAKTGQRVGNDGRSLYV